MNEETWTPRSKILYYLKLITVEPTMLLYMFAFMITTVVEQAFFVNKACRVNHNFNTTICDNIEKEVYKEYNKKVQITVSDFHLWNDIAGHAVPIILAFFVGAWSDKRGRKLPLLIGLGGKLYYSLMIVLISSQDSWPLEYVVYIATLPMAFTGADLTIFAAAFTYLVDVSSQESRTIRVTILEVSYLITMPTGIALGSFLFGQVVNKSYTLMFIINSSLMIISILYSLIKLKWRTNPRQNPLSEASNIFFDFFDHSHFMETLRTFSKKRPNKKRRYLLLLVLMMALYTFQRDEKQMSYLYTQLVFNWNLSAISLFKTVQSALQAIVLVTAIPLMSKILGWRDTVIIMFGALSHSLARIFYANAMVGWVFYTGAVFASFGPIVGPVIRSIVSKIATDSEKGKAFAILSVADNAVPLISGVCYSKLYNATIHNHPNSIYYLTIGTQLAVFLFALYIHLAATNEQFTDKREGGETYLNEEIEPQATTS